MRVIAAILFVALMGAGLGRAQIIYGDVLYAGKPTAQVNRDHSNIGTAVGAQLNGWNTAPCRGPCWTFALATEAVGYPGSGGYLIAIENAVGNMEPSNWSRKIANNAVFKCRPDGSAPCANPSNVDSIAYWVSSQPETGFVAALKLDRYSIHDSPAGERATVIDIADLDPARNAQIVLLKLPGGREVTIAEFIRALDRK